MNNKNNLRHAKLIFFFKCFSVKFDMIFIYKNIIFFINKSYNFNPFRCSDIITLKSITKKKTIQENLDCTHKELLRYRNNQYQFITFQIYLTWSFVTNICTHIIVYCILLQLDLFFEQRLNICITTQKREHVNMNRLLLHSSCFYHLCTLLKY